MSLLVVAALIAFIAGQSVEPKIQDPAARGKAVIDHIIAGEFAKIEDQFTAEMTAAMPSGRLAAAWAGVIQRAGALKGCDADARVVTIGDKQMVIRGCTFERGSINVQFAFDRNGKISGLAFRPPAVPEAPYVLPSYANPSSYSETPLTVGSAEWALPGILTLPNGSTPVPAFVLVHGSGPNDRDETVGPNKPFKDLALGLASRGVAVVRYDKRSKAHPGKLATVQGFTVRQEVIDDMVEAVKALRTQPRVDASRIFVLGHSLGGMLVPRIAEADRTVAGFVLLAGAAGPMEDAIVEQTRYIASADGSITPEEQQAIDNAEAVMASVRALQPSDATSDRMIFGAPASYWLDLRGYDPPLAAKAITAPMLVLQGERDYQVTMKTFARWKAALSTRKDVTFRSYPALNHLFIAGTGPSLPTEYRAVGHVAEEVIRDISTWILEQRRSEAR